jgi:outer membrane receptor protein involved in Fe transport
MPTSLPSVWVTFPERWQRSPVCRSAPGFNENRDLTGSPSKAKFTETTGRIGLDWQINDSTMVYGFFTRGYKPGGFNPPLNESFVQSRPPSTSLIPSRSTPSRSVPRTCCSMAH